MATHWRCELKTFGVVLCAEAEVYAGVEELAGENWLSTESVNCPRHVWMQILLCCEEKVKGADAMDCKRFLKAFGDCNVLREKTFLDIQISAQAVETTFSDGYHLRMAR